MTTAPTAVVPQLPREVLSIILEHFVEPVSIDVDPSRLRVDEEEGVVHFDVINGTDEPEYVSSDVHHPELTRAGLLWSPDAQQHPARLWRQTSEDFRIMAEPYIWQNVWLLNDHNDMMRSLQHIKETYGDTLRDKLSAHTTSFMYSHWPSSFNWRPSLGDRRNMPGLCEDFECAGAEDPFVYHGANDDTGTMLPAPVPVRCPDRLKGKHFCDLVSWLCAMLTQATGWSCSEFRSKNDLDATARQELTASIVVSADSPGTMPRWLYLRSPLLCEKGGGAFFKLVQSLDSSVNLTFDLTPAARGYIGTGISRWMEKCSGHVTLLCAASRYLAQSEDPYERLRTSAYSAEGDLTLGGLWRCHSFTNDNPFLIARHLDDSVLASVNISMVSTGWPVRVLKSLQEGFLAIRPALLRLYLLGAELNQEYRPLTASNIMRAISLGERPDLVEDSKRLFPIQRIRDARKTFNRTSFDIGEAEAQKIADAFNDHLPEKWRPGAPWIDE